MWKLFLVFSTCVLAADQIDDYLELVKAHAEQLGPIGSHLNGEIEMVTERKAIEEIEELVKQRLIKEGFSATDAFDGSRVGVIAEYKYWLWIRDAVTFPTGHKGTYNRIIWRSQLSGPPAVAVIPTFSDGKIGLVLNYRHSTRQWHVQLPAGVREPQEDIEAAARRELKEETGFDVSRIKYVATISPDNGITATKLPIYRGYISKTSLNTQDPTEAIETNIVMKPEKILEGLKTGHVEVTIKGKLYKVACNDPALFFAAIPE